ncbi:MAG: DUF4126 domain-containing protein [Chthoniobacterales bacterium]
METLELLGVALGLAALAGINLYLTVFATGLAIRMGWLQLSPQYESLSILADPTILTIAGVFFIAEFFADKVPWVDTAWDTVHTFIRPVGAAFLAISVLGDTSPVFDVIVALLGGSVALSTHATKTGSRLLINASPEPFTNIGASLAGEGLVLGGIAVTFLHPILALACALGILLVILLFGPRVARTIRSRLRFIWKKITAPALRDSKSPEAAHLSSASDSLLHRIHPGDFQIAKAFDATSIKVHEIPTNTFGQLVITKDKSIYFVGKVWWRVKASPIDTRGLKANYQRGFLADQLTLHSSLTNQKATLYIDRVTRINVEDWLEKFEKDLEAEEKARVKITDVITPPTTPETSTDSDLEATVADEVIK